MSSSCSVRQVIDFKRAKVRGVEGVFESRLSAIMKRLAAVGSKWESVASETDAMSVRNHQLSLKTSSVFRTSQSISPLNCVGMSVEKKFYRLQSHDAPTVRPIK